MTKKLIIIRSSIDGFRRCGIAHPAAETSYPLDRFTKDELDILGAEPVLMVGMREVLDDKGEDAAADGEGGTEETSATADGAEDEAKPPVTPDGKGKPRK